MGNLLEKKLYELFKKSDSIESISNNATMEALMQVRIEFPATFPISDSDIEKLILGYSTDWHKCKRVFRTILGNNDFHWPAFDDCVNKFKFKELDDVPDAYFFLSRPLALPENLEDALGYFSYKELKELAKQAGKKVPRSGKAIKEMLLYELKDRESELLGLALKTPEVEKEKTRFENSYKRAKIETYIMTIARRSGQIISSKSFVTNKFSEVSILSITPKVVRADHTEVAEEICGIDPDYIADKKSIYRLPPLFPGDDSRIEYDVISKAKLKQT